MYRKNALFDLTDNIVPPFIQLDYGIQSQSNIFNTAEHTFSISINVSHTDEADLPDFGCCACLGCGQDAIKDMLLANTPDVVTPFAGATDTIAGDSSTTASVIVGGQTSGVRNTSTDSDWFAVDLVNGQTYTFFLIRDEVDGVTPHEDPLLRLIDTDGVTELAENDDFGSRNSAITFTATETGTYYLSAEGWTTTTGGYTLFAEQGSNRPDFSIDQVAYFLTHQYDNYSYWNQTAISYNIEGLPPEAHALAELSFDAWEEVSGLTFVRVTTGGDITFDDNQSGAFASTNAPSEGGVITSATINVETNWTTDGGVPVYDVNSYRYQTYIHEIGHALGLGHGGPYNGSATHGTDNLYNQDAWNYTVMSYFDQTEASTGTARLVLGLQIADILAIQNVYGAATNTRSGDTVYGFNTTETGTVYDFADWQNNGTRPPSFSIADTGGTDTLDMSGYIANQTIDLRQEQFSSVGDNTNTAATDDALENLISIARGAVIENAVGGSGDDTLIGNDADNVLTGNAGDDNIQGGAGTDYAAYSGNEADYSVIDNMDGTFTVSGNGEGTDLLTDVEFVRFADADVALGVELPSTFTNGDDIGQGTSGDDVLDGLDGNDVIDGLAGNDTLFGSDGRDTLIGGAGADALDGGAGNDTILFEGAAPVSIRLWNGTGNRNDAAGDTYTNIENVTTGDGADLVIGDLNRNVLRTNGGDDVINGLAGNDILIGGAGADTLDGGDGVDTLIIGGSDNVVVRLSNGTGRFGDAEGDTYANIENVRTGAGDDLVVGTNDRNIIRGLDGDDNLRGLDGNDRIVGGRGEDLIEGGRDDDDLFGGGQADTFIMSVGHGNDRIFDFNSFEDFVDLRSTGFTDFSDIQSALTDSAGYTTLQIDATTSIRFDGMQASDFSSSNFLLDGVALSSEPSGTSSDAGVQISSHADAQQSSAKPDISVSQEDLFDFATQDIIIEGQLAKLYIYDDISVIAYQDTDGFFKLMDIAQLDEFGVQYDLI